MFPHMLRSVKYVLSSDSNDRWKREEKRSNAGSSKREKLEKNNPIHVVRDPSAVNGQVNFGSGAVCDN
jgi:hypothetical protein